MSKTKFQQLTNKALAALALECGLKRSGTKPDLQATLRSVVDSPPVTPPKSLRITSIDMGVRNLSVCQVTLGRTRIEKENAVTPTSTVTQDAKVEKKTKATKTKTKAKDSTKDTTPEPDSGAISPTILSADVSVATVSTWNTRDISEFSTSPGATQEDIPWDLRNDSLLEVAYNFVSRELLGDNVRKKPHVVLLERQRHRSQGSPSVLEWVFRVNMFESILAGTVYTYKQRSHDKKAGTPENIDSDSHNTDLFRVDPRMVADYFIRGKRAKGKKFDIKAEKIGVVGQWLEAESHDLPEFENMVKMQAVAEKPKPKKSTRKKKDEEAEVVEEIKPLAEEEVPRDETPPQPMERKLIPRDLKSIPGFSPLTPQLHSLASHLEVMSSILAKKRYNSVKSKKADDVADSLLQALAWYNWQYNREYLRELLENEDDERWLEVNAWVKENVE
ncbi:YALIA101S05e09208g1_1 [Yarrowia lipolytica]|nr:Hypothetical protein YALI2_E00182g [Yarrowia lipolytica]SEI34720.1 YALIA101S05e09208g1_1 [Yarrowia lipolytica]